MWAVNSLHFVIARLCITYFFFKLRHWLFWFTVELRAMKSHTRPKSHAHRTLPPSRRPQPVSASKSNPKRMHWCCRCLLSCIASVVLLLVITLLRSDSISPVAYELPEPPQQVGPLTPNEVLKNAEVLFKHKIKGPESIVVHDGKSFRSKYHTDLFIILMQ